MTELIIYLFNNLLNKKKITRQTSFTRSKFPK